jgi:hypothetical protein
MRERLAGLPEICRVALAATAALSRPTPELVAREFGGEDALRPALRAHVLEVDGDRLRFTHPLLAATAYEEVDVIGRRALHRRLAALVRDEEEGARHLALGADGPDPEVAAALERAAEHARTRGATVAAAELCEAARRLTPADAVSDGYRRAILAARYRWLSGDARGAAAVLEGVITTAPVGQLRAEAMVTLASAHQIGGIIRGPSRSRGGHWESRGSTMPCARRPRAGSRASCCSCARSCRLGCSMRAWPLRSPSDRVTGGCGPASSRSCRSWK